MRPDTKKKMFDNSAGKKRGGYRDVRSKMKREELTCSPRKLAGWDRKHTGESYSMVRKFLKSHVGRPWNKVWSEICRANDRRNFNGYTLRDMVMNSVAMSDRIYIKDNKPYYLNRFWRGVDVPYDGFYVNTDTGLLCYAKKARRVWKPAHYKVYNIEGVDYFSFDGIWYEVVMKPIPPVKPGSFRADYTDVFATLVNKNPKDPKQLLYNYFDFSPIRFYGKKGIYCHSKRQVNARTVRKIKKWLAENGLSLEIVTS